MLLADSFIAFFSLSFSAWLLEDGFAEYSSGFLVKNMLVFALVTTACFLVLHTHRQASQLSLRTDMPALTVAAVLATALFYPLMQLLGQLEQFSNPTPFLNMLVLLGAWAVPRVCAERARSRHFSLSWRWRPHESLRRRNKTALDYVAEPVPISAHAMEVLLVGELSALDAFFTHSASAYPDFRPVAIVTTKPQDFGIYVHNVPVLGDLPSLDAVLETHTDLGFQYVLVVPDGITSNTINAIAEASRRSGTPVLRLPTAPSEESVRAATTPHQKGSSSDV